MKSWRERIAEAQERKRTFLGRIGWRSAFTPEDHETWASIFSCPVGEVRNAYGVTSNLECRARVFLMLEFSTRFHIAMCRNRPQEASRILDELEDRALQLKREAGA